MFRALRLLLLGLFSGLLLASALLPGAVQADTNADVVKALTTHDVYVTPVHLTKGRVRPSDRMILQAAVDRAANRGVQEKIAIVSHIPSNFANIGLAADGLRNYLAFSGLLVLVGPSGIAVSTDTLTVDERTVIARKARPRCLTLGYASCAAYASVLTVAKIHADDSSSFHNTVVFWIVFLAAIGVFGAAIVLIIRGRRGHTNQRLGELRRAGAHTLGLADSAIAEIEAHGEAMPPDVRAQYDTALGLRNRARDELDAARTERSLTGGNEDAAQAVLALGGVMRALNIRSALSDPTDLPARRCFYCGRTDRAPYVERTVEDGKGNSMTVDVCAVDAGLLNRGQTPPVATVQHNGMSMPWWAVANSPWYYSYGGPSWQYWLPFAVGMNVGGWMDGGWTGGYGNYGMDGGYGGDYGGGNVDAGAASGTAADPGGADFGGWGGDSGGGGWGGDSGGWGGDSGAGGADFGGGGDSGGGGDGGGGGWG